jgi:hypothetical protein
MLIKYYNFYQELIIKIFTNKKLPSMVIFLFILNYNWYRFCTKNSKIVLIFLYGHKGIVDATLNFVYFTRKTYARNLISHLRNWYRYRYMRLFKISIFPLYFNGFVWYINLDIFVPPLNKRKISCTFVFFKKK